MSAHDTEAVIERVARAIDEAPYWDSGTWLGEAKSALSALRPGDRLPNGLICVPEEPSEAMVEAALNAGLDIYWSYRAEGEPGGPADVYRAMLAACGEGQ